MRFASVFAMVLLFLSCVTVWADDPMENPFGYFNVYSLGDIGSSSDKYHSDFQGVGGAAGDVFFSSFSLHGMESDSDYVLHTGGSATLTGSYLKGVEIGGDAHLGNLNINGTVAEDEAVGFRYLGYLQIQLRLMQQIVFNAHRSGIR